MTDMWGLALGILFFAVWLVFMFYYDSVHQAYTQGKIDQIRHKIRYTSYHGVPAFFYRRGRIAVAKHNKARVHQKLSGNNHGPDTPR